MKDTAISLTPELRSRLMQGYGFDSRPTPAWDLDAFASAGGIRSTAGDMLTYLEAQLHPERSPFPAALVRSQRIRDHVDGDMDIALAWIYDPDKGIYWHSGATGGYTTYACFIPKRDFAAVVMLNAYPAAFPFTGVLSEHVVERISGKPALSLAPISVPPAGPVRSFFAYWIAMVAAGVFIFCCVLALQGFAALLASPAMVAARLRVPATRGLLPPGQRLFSAALAGHGAGDRFAAALAILDSVVLVRRPVPAVERLAAPGPGAVCAARMDRSRCRRLRHGRGLCGFIFPHPAQNRRAARYLPGLQQWLAAAFRRLIRNRHRAIQYSKPGPQPPASHDFRLLPGRFRLRDPVLKCPAGNRGPHQRRGPGSPLVGPTIRGRIQKQDRDGNRRPGRRRKSCDAGVRTGCEH